MAMAPVFYNNKSFVITHEITPTTTVLHVAANHGIRPLSPGKEYIVGTIVPRSGEGDLEIIHIIGVDDTTFIIERGKEDTNPQSYLLGAVLELRLTAESIRQMGAQSLREDLLDPNNPEKGAGMVARSTITVDRISDLQDLPIGLLRSDLRFSVLGYHEAHDDGGGIFIWEEGNTENQDNGMVFISNHSTAGRFLRVPEGNYIHTRWYGIDHTGVVPANQEFQAMLDKAKNIGVWLDDGVILITSNIFYESSEIKGSGTLSIVVDENFTVVDPSLFIANEAVLIPNGPYTNKEHVIDWKFKMTFNNKVPKGDGPWYPFRGMNLRNSTFDLDCYCWGSDSATDTDLPDFYFDNRNVDIKGRYVLRVISSDQEGGMWIRDVGMQGEDNENYYSENVIVKSGTYIDSNGLDEALAFFNPAGGTMKNCGVEAATIIGHGIGLSFLEFNAAHRSHLLFDCFAEGTKVVVKALRKNQAVVKVEKTLPRLIGVTARIDGFDDYVTEDSSQFYAAFRNTQPRNHGHEIPSASGCRAIINSDQEPKIKTIAFDGHFLISDPMVLFAKSDQIKFDLGIRNGYISRGGLFHGAKKFGENLVEYADTPYPVMSDFGSGFARFSGVSNRGRAPFTLNSSGQIQINHGLYFTPSFADVVPYGATNVLCMVVSVDNLHVIVELYNRDTGTKITGGTHYLMWRAEA